ncbi:MAG: hypothetical protein LC687_00310 [Actinobacteria bacterium]|nr:hypothetical protein [Actinomycetota bacterium]MCA1806313.1 hypothetical protein [Actinomycetota bacterium]
MLDVKMFEVRDAATFIPVMATKLNVVSDSQEDWLLHRGGFAKFEQYILYTSLVGHNYKTFYDPFDHTSRTHHYAHLYIHEHWGELGSGDVIDVEFIMKQTERPKTSERFIVPEDGEI